MSQRASGGGARGERQWVGCSDCNGVERGEEEKEKKKYKKQSERGRLADMCVD